MSAVLHLLLADDAAARPPIVALELAGRADERLVTGLLERVPAGRRRMFPAPGPESAPAEVRGWYRDLWWALPADERRSVVAAAGPGAACLAPLLGRKVRIVANVREPVAALVAAGVRLPNRSALLSLRDDPRRSIKPRLHALSNPQVRELLVPWSEADELPVTVGPPPYADRWRWLLFNKALRQLRPAPLGAPSAHPAAASVLPGGQEYRELLLTLNWLDQELYESMRSRAARARPTPRPGVATAQGRAMRPRRRRW